MSEYQFNEFQLKWLEALESGKYKQCRGRLFDGAGHCCIGVACRAIGLEPDETHGFDGSHHHAPPQAVMQLRLRDHYGSFSGVPSADTLIGLNDRLQMPFPEIAAFIRANPKKVFLPSEQTP